MATSKRMEWLKTVSMVAGTTATVAKALLEYRKFRRDQEKTEYTRNLQRRAWEMVMNGELSEAKVDEITLKAPRPPDKPKQKKATAKPTERSAEVSTDAPTGLSKANGKPPEVVAEPVPNATEASEETEPS